MSEKRITAGVVEMLAIIDDPTSTEDERSMAATTIVEGVAPDILGAFVKATERERRREEALRLCLKQLDEFSEVHDDCPGHAHQTAGRWDSDGERCGLCEDWNAARHAARAALTPKGKV